MKFFSNGNTTMFLQGVCFDEKVILSQDLPKRGAVHFSHENSFLEMSISIFFFFLEMSIDCEVCRKATSIVPMIFDHNS